MAQTLFSVGVQRSLHSEVDTFLAQVISHSRSEEQVTASVGSQWPSQVLLNTVKHAKVF